MASPSGVYFEGASGRHEREILFLVEGPDDAYFLDALLTDAGADRERVGIKYMTGRTRLSENVADRVKLRVWKLGQANRVALILDADLNPPVAETDAQAAFKNSGLPVPAHGQVMKLGAVTTGLFIVPSSAHTGNLEKLLFDTVATSALGVACREFYENNRENELPENESYKRIVQAYMACLTVDCRGCGRGFGLGAFDAKSASLTEIRTFVKEFIS